MPTIIQLSVSPAEADNDSFLRQEVSKELKIEDDSFSFRIIRRSIDARNKHIKINLSLEVYFTSEQVPLPIVPRSAVSINSDRTAIVIGSGPAGLFAALELIKNNVKPVVLERGKDVRARRRDLAAINKDHIVNPHSNYCFGEGGAGTYSDGKLYTRSNKRGNVKDVLRTFIEFGAEENILVDAHPHIGTNKLPQIIQSIREYIINSGGEVLFEHHVKDLVIENGALKGVVVEQLNTNKEIQMNGDAIVLATGHSARDIFVLLNNKGVAIEAKPFALGVRIEHPQDQIDAMQYHCKIDETQSIREHLPAASYSWVEQVNERGVFSFCMCPGGIIAPCATSQEEVVTNGWSPSKRNNPFANSGVVVSIEKEDVKSYSEHGALAGMMYQADVERKAWIAGGKKQSAPAQRLVDFLSDKVSSDLPPTSYQPGIVSTSLKDVLPSNVSARLKAGLAQFGKKKKAYLSKEAVLVAVESRTSSPVRIPRDKESCEHPQVKNFYPCGEGAGYAGGIVSAAIDGIKVAKAIAEKLHKK